MSVKIFEVYSTPKESILMETGGREVVVIGRSKVNFREDAECSSSFTVSKHARVPQMEI